MDMLRLSILMKRTTFTNVGSVTQKGSFIYMKIILIMAIAILTSSCTEFAILSSGAGIAVSNNMYAKAYGGLDFLTIINTEKDIKTHIYHSLKKEEDGNK
jgi:hypothetical protein